MKYKLNNNNNKKSIIGISIIFCIFILIIGVTNAYFTQSDSKNIDSIVATNINDTLEYTDNTTYMRQGLIPASVDVAKQAYALEDDKKCIDKYGYSACSVYEFNIKNKAKVSQELIIDMIPTVNTFTNLHFILYEIDGNGNSGEPILTNKIDKLTEEIIQNNNIPTYNLKSEVVLNPGKDKTYQVVFFVNDTESDQTSEDAGKQFGGSIKISSIATGQYMAKNFGTNCWTTELLPDNTYKLTEFHGIDNTLENVNFETREFTLGENFGKISESCTGYIDDDDEDGFYSVYIPSNVGGQQISTIGDALFGTVTMDENYDMKNIKINYAKINDIKIEEGITRIEDGCLDREKCPEKKELSTSFNYLGFDLATFTPYENFKVNLSLPNSLEYIGDNAFVASLINNSVTVPANVTYIGEHGLGNVTELNFIESDNEELKMIIGERAFSESYITSLKLPKKTYKIEDYAFKDSNNLKSVIFSGAKEGKSKLEVIGSNAFDYTSIESLVIPSSVTTIGNFAFYYNKNLTTLTFEGGSKLTTIGDYAFDSNNISSLEIPSSVTTIGNSAFYNNKNLTTLTFEEGSKLTTIGVWAFFSNNISSLVIPSSVTTIGNSAFYNNKNLTTLTFEEGSELTTIGDHAFYSCALDYKTEGSPLYLPNNKFEKMGDYAFSNNTNLKYIYYEGDATGFGSMWNGNATLLPLRQ